MPKQENDPYASWARTLLDRFFGPHMAGQRARLVVTRNLLDEDYPHLGGSAGFINTVKQGARFLGSQFIEDNSFHNHAQKLYRLWLRSPALRPKGSIPLPDNAPLYLPHLAALCLGWTINPDDEEIAANAFYQRLAAILPNHGLDSNELAKWRQLWDGLEKWSDGLGGKRGIFKVEILGHFAHVGIPLSQVLLTPSKVSNLAELFVTTGLSDNWKEADAASLRTILVANESRSRAALGGMLYREIKIEESAIGIATIERLLEFLADPAFREWPPQGYEITAADSGGPIVRNPTMRIRLVLELIDHPRAWRCRFGILGTDPPSSSPTDAGWSFLKVDERLGGLWLASNNHSGDNPIDAGEWNHALSTGLSIDCLPASGHDEETTTLKLPARKIRVFHETGWIGQRLVEEDSLPTSGGCFVLASGSIMGQLKDWIGRFKGCGGVVTDYTLVGLPGGITLFHFAGMERGGEGLIRDFPEGSIARGQPRSCIYLRGGSQVQGTGRQQVYLPYDPPDVILVAPSCVRLECTGAVPVDDAASVGSWSVPEGMPGLEPRQYRLEVESDVGQVRVSAVASDKEWIPEVVTFGVGREAALGANFAEDASVRFDFLGMRTDGEGIFGGLIDKGAWQSDKSLDRWNFEDRDLELGEPATTALADHQAWCLLESLAQDKRVTAQEFRRRCERILKWWPQYAWSEARWIRALCHVEVERDNRGRIAYVYPVPPHAYLLPYKKQGRWLAVLGGCPTRETLRRLLEAARLLDVDVFCMERKSPLLPPRWLCHARDLIAIELALDEAQIRLAADVGAPLPLCASVGEWAASMDHWLGKLHWLEGPPPASEKIFNPRHFQMATNEFFACPYKVISITDSLTQKHQWHMLHDNGALRGGPKHAFLLDLSWGKWHSMSKIASEFGCVAEDEEDPLVPLPFDAASGSLHVPASLVFPTMISRALLTCSGMPPATLTKGSPYYRKVSSPFMPSEEPSYEGACHRYDDLHPKVVRAACAKVRAQAIDA